MNDNQFKLKRFFQVIFIETILISLCLALIPGYASDGLFNLSKTRLLILGGFILIGALLGALLYITTRGLPCYVKINNYLNKIVDSPKLSSNLFTSSSSTALLIFTLLIFLFIINSNLSLFIRILPILVFAFLISLQFSILIKSIQTDENWSHIKTQFLEFLEYILLGIGLSTIILLAFINERDFSYITRWGAQYRRHSQVLDSTAKAPWTYRLFPAYVAQAIISFIALFREWRSVATGFIILRISQTTLIFYLFKLYLKKLGIDNKSLIILGNLLLAWAYTHAHYDSDLSFNIYFDIIFFLCGVIAILDKKTSWIIPISILAATNRVTGILIPFLLLASVYLQNKKGQINKRDLVYGLFSILLFTGINLSIRYYIDTNYSPQKFITAQGHNVGLDIFVFNLTFLTSWIMLFKTFNLIPIIAIFYLKESPKLIQSFFWIVIPIWIIIHLFYSVIAETRIFLVPYSLILLPIVLMKINNSTIKKQLSTIAE